MNPETAALHRRLAEVDERIDRVGKRFTAGYGSDADREAWLAWLRELQAKRAMLLAALEPDAASGRASEGGADAPGRSSR
jgi:hypothetical protein